MVRILMRRFPCFYGLTLAVIALLPVALLAVDKNFHNAPDSTKALKDPVEGQPQAREAGGRLSARNFLSFHGKNGQGSGNVPSLADAKLDSVPAGEVFWFITKGSKENGMPSWAFLPQQQRWQIVPFVRSAELWKAAANRHPPAPGLAASSLKAPPPPPPFADFRYEKPGTTRKITVNDLPQSYATKSAENSPDVVARPANVWPIAPAGFKVEQYAAGLDDPRLLRTGPNGDIFLAESTAGRIRVFRGLTSDGRPEQMQIFASGLKRPYGIALYPPGKDPQWMYVGNT